MKASGKIHASATFINIADPEGNVHFLLTFTERKRAQQKAAKVLEDLWQVGRSAAIIAWGGHIAGHSLGGASFFIGAPQNSESEASNNTT